MPRADSAAGSGHEPPGSPAERIGEVAMRSEILDTKRRTLLRGDSTGNFELGADASAVAIVAAAGAQVGTTGSSATASVGQDDVKAVGAYCNGMAVFTVAKGGLMYEASIGGQKFTYSPI
jgi:hypothetical protein